MRALTLALLLTVAGCRPAPTVPPPTPTSTPTATATERPTATEDPTATPTVELTATSESTAPATVTATPAAIVGSPTAAPVTRDRPLTVEFTDLHYECNKECWSNYDYRSGWGYRGFQLLMTVTNNSADLTLAGGDHESQGWAPSKWFVTDGRNTHTDEYAWQWTLAERNLMRRPDLGPGASAEWTWLAFPLAAAEWVAAVEYVDPWGNVYRQEFGQPTAGESNYVDCGDPRTGNC